MIYFWITLIYTAFHVGWVLGVLHVERKIRAIAAEQDANVRKNFGG